MKLPLDFFDHLRNVISVSDIVGQKVSLTKKGSEHSGLCPFHNEKTPSFTVNDAKRFYHCFGCGAHGDIIKFTAEINGLSYSEAAKKLALDHGIDLPKISKQQQEQYAESDKIYDILNLAAEFFRNNLNSEVINYLEKRNIKKETIDQYLIGYAPGKKTLEEFFKTKSISWRDLIKAGLMGKRDSGEVYEIFNNRIIYPIKNIYNKVVGFGGRSLGNIMPKYINSPETLVFKKSELMYGENIANSFAYKDNFSIIVEGYMDVIALHQAGFKHAVASLGTAVTENHIKKLWRCCNNIIMCLDGDDAGTRATEKVVNMTLPYITPEKTISFIKLPYKYDPDDYIQKYGKDNFDNLLKNPIRLSETIWQKEFDNITDKSPETKALLEKKLMDYCALIKNSSLQSSFKYYFKNMIWENLVKKDYSNNQNKQINKKIGDKIKTLDKYTELEFLEYSLMYFILDSINIIANEEHHIKFTINELNEFYDWLIESYNVVYNTKNTAIKHSLMSNIKNSRFYNTYMLVLGFGDAYLKSNCHFNGNLDKRFSYDWLCKKHHLALLKQEYLELSKCDSNKEKLMYYLKEIQKISLELEKSNNDIADNQF